MPTLFCPISGLLRALKPLILPLLLCKNVKWKCQAGERAGLLLRMLMVEGIRGVIQDGLDRLSVGEIFVFMFRKWPFRMFTPDALTVPDDRQLSTNCYSYRSNNS